MFANHNIIAMNGQRQYKAVTNRKEKRTEKLASGYKINRAADNAAGLSISEKMRYQIRGLTQGIKNMQEGVGYCKVADGALNEMHGMLQRMNELAVQAANGTYSDMDREAIDQEVQHLKEEMDRICDTTKYNEEFIFKCDDNETDPPVEPYQLAFTGHPDDLYIYNDSYDKATGTATFGGIAYRGKRYDWNMIDPGMYDSATGTFHAGTYTLNTDDGSVLNLVCEEGSKPPQVSREFNATANGAGIYINNEQIPWDKVQTDDGQSLKSGNIENKPYYIHYHGVSISFTPEAGDEFTDVVNKLSGSKWKSTYKIPTEKEALYANFSNTYKAFKNNQEVKDYLSGQSSFAETYTLRAGDGTNGTFDGLWLEQNGSKISQSEKSWADLGITNWEGNSTDIWSDKTYTYTYKPDPNIDDQVSFSFQVINEISKDSAIDAFDGVSLPGLLSHSLSNHTSLEMDAAYKNVMSGKISKDTVKLTLGEEYGLGRDFTTVSDTFNSVKLSYDGTKISAEHKATVDGVETKKLYSNTAMETDAIITKIKNQIKTDMKDYLDVIEARYIAGASDPTEVNLAALLAKAAGTNTGHITGDGGNTYLEDVVTFDPADIKNGDLKSTLYMGGKTSYAGASIDFSGLGTAYQLADLIGMGFNSTCQTCSNHYSIQFTNPDITQADWKSTQDGYQYSYQRQGQNHTLYIDVRSMENGITDGTAFTNALLDIVDTSGYDFHFTQYATYTNDATLYIFDNRPQYASNGTSTATNASFSPYAYGFNSVAAFQINLFDDSNSSEQVSLNYEYNYSDLFGPSNLEFEYVQDAAGDYVKIGDQYVKFDGSNPDHQGLTRYRRKVKFKDKDDQGNPVTIDNFLENYIKNHILKDTAEASNMSFVSDYAKYRLGNKVNENKAIVTEYDTPHQVLMPRRSGGILEEGGIKIQCSSNTKDSIYMEKQRLSVHRMGLKNLNVMSEQQATRAIDLLDHAFIKVNGIRSKFGTYQNRLEHSIANAANVAENTTAAESRIRDTDMAKEMQAFSVDNILMQAGEAILAQANMTNQNVVSLLQF